MERRKILVFGGAGYIGTQLTSHLLNAGFDVTVFDTFWYGNNVKVGDGVPIAHFLKGDIRDLNAVRKALVGITDVIHLACISNDPSFDLDPELGKSINLNSFKPLVLVAKQSGVKRFIFASSSSVYGVKEEEKVTELLSLEPLTDYSKFKVICEEIILENNSNDFVCTVFRPATVCGFSFRQRFDLSVNILTNHAISRNEILVFGGNQQRPNLHIEDMCRAYSHVLNQPTAAITGKIYNVGGENLSLDEIAAKVKIVTKMTGAIVHQSSDDLRSYRVDSSKIERELGFTPNLTVQDAVADLLNAFNNNKFSNSLENSNYFNIRRMKELALG
jgi:nucleoside-diphosphate-sugar epimerase